MRLTVREAAQRLQVPEEVVYKFIRDKGLPAVKFNEQYRINSVELAEWAQENRVTLLPEAPPKHKQKFISFADALATGGVHRGLSGKTKRDALRAAVECLRLPSGADRQFLLQMLLAREDQGSTGFGDGIAIPHVRNPIVLHIDKPAVSLCFLKEPIDFGALDEKPVSALFTMVNPTIRVHLHLFSRLAFLLKAPNFVQKVKAQASEEEILQEARTVEERMGSNEPGPLQV